MKFNYAREKRDFEVEWEETASVCKHSGMSDSDLAKLRETYLEAFNSDRKNYRYRAHGVDYCDLISNPEDRVETGGIGLAVQYDCFDGHSRYWWLEVLSDPRLLKKITSLSIYEKELLTLKFKEQRTYKEMSIILKVPLPTVASQVEKLCKVLGQ